MTNLQMI